MEEKYFFGFKPKPTRSEVEHKRLLNELKDVKAELKVKTDFYEIWKQQQDDYLDLKRQMQQMVKERDNLSKELVYYKQKCSELRKKSKELEATLSSTEKSLQERVHGLETKVEKIQKNKTFLKDNTVTVKYHRGELAQIDKELLKEKMRHCDLEQQLRKMTNEKEFRQSQNIIVNVPKLNKHEVFMDFQKNKHLKMHLVTTKQELAKVKERIKKEQIKEEKQKVRGDPKQSKTQLQPKEKVQQCHQTIRDQSKKIQELTGTVNMYRVQAEEYKEEKVKLADETQTNKKLYLDKKMENLETREALKSGVVQPSKDKSDVTPLPPTNGLFESKDQLEKPIKLPAIPRKSQLGSEGKSVDKRPKNIVYLTAEKIDQILASENNQHKLKGKSRYTILPPISVKSVTPQRKIHFP